MQVDTLVPLEIQVQAPGPLAIVNTGLVPVYYRSKPAVSAGVHDGELAAGATLTLKATTWLLGSAAGAQVDFAEPDDPGGAGEPYGAAILGADGKVGGTGGSALSSSVASRSEIAAPKLYEPEHLRRWAAKRGGALFGLAPIMCVGDSITYGQGGDNENAAGTTHNVADASGGWVGQLRSLFANRYGDPGEGFIFPDESRCTLTGSPVSSTSYNGVLRHNILLNTAERSIALTIPEGITRLGVIESNGSTDKSARWKKNGTEQGSVQALTGTLNPIMATLEVAAGDEILLYGPASTQTAIVGLVLMTSLTTGVPVHRMGQPGYTIGDALGGETSGTLNLSEASQLQMAKSTHVWQSGGGLVVCSFGVNDQQNQLLEGSAGGITAAKYKEWVQRFVNRVVVSGWCSLLLGEPPNPNAVSVEGGMESDYKQALREIAEATDHVAFMDIGEMWDSAEAAALGLQFGGSVHPERAGHGDMAVAIHEALTRPYKLY